MAYEPKKNNLFFMAAPPMLPPKSFKWYLGFAAPLASFTQLFAFNAELRWSSKRRPWNVLLPRRVTKLTWKFDCPNPVLVLRDRKSTRLNSSHGYISYAVFCLKKKKHIDATPYSPFAIS